MSTGSRSRVSSYCLMLRVETIRFLKCVLDHSTSHRPGQVRAVLDDNNELEGFDVMIIGMPARVYLALFVTLPCLCPETTLSVVPKLDEKTLGFSSIWSFLRHNEWVTPWLSNLWYLRKLLVGVALLYGGCRWFAATESWEDRPGFRGHGTSERLHFSNLACSRGIHPNLALYLYLRTLEWTSWTKSWDLSLIKSFWMVQSIASVTIPCVFVRCFFNLYFWVFCLHPYPWCFLSGAYSECFGLGVC